MANALVLMTYLYMFMIFFIAYKYFSSTVDIDVNMNIFYLLMTVFVGLIISYTYYPKKTVKKEFFIEDSNKTLSFSNFENQPI